MDGAGRRRTRFDACLYRRARPFRSTERVPKAETSIQTFPKAGSYDAETGTYDRYIPKTRIVLTYVLRDDVVWIVAAWHTSRDPATKPRREP